jgi:hypothetical protein
MTSLKNTWKPLFGLAIALLLSACGKSTESTSGTFTQVYTNTLSRACIECHKPGTAATDQDGVTLNFSTQATAFSTLLESTVRGASSTGTCGSVKIVTAGSVENSYLAGVLFTDYHKDNFAGVSGCTPYAVHLQNQNLSASEKTTILDWIRNGALNN